MDNIIAKQLFIRCRVDKGTHEILKCLDAHHDKHIKLHANEQGQNAQSLLHQLQF